MSGPRPERDYHDVPGTYVLDGEHCRKGYAVNMFCMSLNQQTNRDAFRTGPDRYLDRFDLTVEQRRAILERDWLGLLRLGGNIYYTLKLAAFDGLTVQQVGGAMSGVSGEEFTDMMIGGGRPIEGNRSRRDWGLS